MRISDWSSDVCSSDLRLVGILTHRDVRFARDKGQPVRDLMTKRVVTVREDVSPEAARDLLHRHRIEKLLVVDDDRRCVGLITVKDMAKAKTHPNAAKETGRPSRRERMCRYG